MSGRLLVVEDHVLVAVGMQLALSSQCWEVETTHGPTAADVVSHAQRFEPHCVLLDIHLGRQMGSGIELIGPLTSTGARVVMLTAETRRMVLAECLEAGAAGWISKGAMLDEVDSTLRRILACGTAIGRADREGLLAALRLERAAAVRRRASFEHLTERESRVLAALSNGLSAEEIAETQFVALSTVRSQIRAVLQKLNVRSQAAAVVIAGAHPELLPPDVMAGRDRRRAQLQPQSCGPDFRR